MKWSCWNICFWSCLVGLFTEAAFVFLFLLNFTFNCTVKIPLYGLSLSESPIIRIGLEFRVNLSRNLWKYLALKLRVVGSSTVQCTVYSVQCTVYSVQRTVQNFKSSVVERVRRRYILLGITTELQTANVAYFQRKVELSGFSAYPNDSPSQLIWISGVLLCSYSVVFRNNNQTSNCQCSLFSKKVELSGFSAYPNGSPFQLIWISGVLLCSYSIVYFAFT